MRWSLLFAESTTRKTVMCHLGGFHQVLQTGYSLNQIQVEITGRYVFNIQAGRLRDSIIYWRPYSFIMREMSALVHELRNQACRG